LTCFVVFLFALIGNWNWHLLRARIFDTALGALIALIVGGFFFSLKTNVANVFVGYVQKMKAILLTELISTNQRRTAATSQYLAADFQKIRKAAIAIRYELLFYRLSAQDFNTLLNQTSLCTRYVINLIESYHWLLPHLCKTDVQLINMAAVTTTHNIESLALCLDEKMHPAMIPAVNVSDLITNAIADNPARFATLESDALGFFSLMYFFTRLNTSLNEMYLLASKS